MTTDTAPAASGATEVLIIGAGPTGLMLANLLGGYGHRVVVLEQRGALIDYPRGVGLDDESLRTIQQIGLIEQVRPHTTPQHIMRLVNGRHRTMLVNDPRTTEFGWERKHGFIQPEVDRVLHEGLARFPQVEVRFGHEVVDVVETDDSVTAIARVDGTDEEVRICAQYLVGCEGGKSPTRKRLGVSFDGVSPSTRWLVVDVANDPLGTPNVFLGADPRRPYVSIGLPHAVRRWEFMLFDDECEEVVTDPAWSNRILADHVPDPGALDVIRRRVFTHHARVAGEFRGGRQLIAGDAAHLMPVWLGQGWNSGVRDATNLGWKLSTVLRGDADDALLDTYTTERRDHARSIVDLSLAFGNVVKITNPVLAAARDAASEVLNLLPGVRRWFAEMRFKPMPRYRVGVLADPTTGAAGRAGPRLTSRSIPVRTAAKRDSPVGLLFPQPMVRTAAHGDARLDDAIGGWWALLVWGNSPLDVLPPSAIAKLERLGARLVSIVPETQREWAERRMVEQVLVVGDASGELKRWFDERPTPFVLLRPDRFVAAAGLHQHGPMMIDAVLAAMRFRSPDGRDQLGATTAADAAVGPR